MKSTLLKYLPMAAALTIATACSNDDENIIVPQPVLEAESVQPASVKVPFSIKVENGTKSLTKMLTKETQNGDNKSMTFSFEDDDIDHYVVYITEWTEHEYLSEDYQYLTLSKINNEFVFTGELSVNGSKLFEFISGNCWLTADLMPKKLLDDFKNNQVQYVDMFADSYCGESLREVLHLTGDFVSNADRVSLRSPSYVYFNIEDPSVEKVDASIYNEYANPKTRSYSLDLKKYKWFAFKVAIGDAFSSDYYSIKNQYIDGNEIYRINRRLQIL